MQIFWTDNFNRDTVSERVVATNIQNKGEAETMLQALKATCDNRGPDWYRLAEDTDEPYRFEL